MLPPTTTHARIDGPLVLVGFGSIGKGTLPLILRHIDVARERMVIIDPDDSSRGIADLAGIRFEKVPLLPETLRAVLTPLLKSGGFLVNLSVGVSSVALVELCRELGALYLDTCIEPPPGGYTDPTKSISERSNYAMRESALALRRHGNDPTAVIAHGANPGMVSHLVKRALLHLARDLGLHARPAKRDDWARLARDLGIKGIHIAERDTQRARIPKQKDEFVNTWSIDGFLSEGLQPSELGWGTHENSRTGRSGEAVQHCQTSLRIYQAAAKADPNDVQSADDLATAFSAMSDVLDRMGKTADAIGWETRARNFYRTIEAKDPDSIQTGSDDASSLVHFGILESKLGSREAARRDLSLAQAMVQPQMHRSPKNLQLRGVYDRAANAMNDLK